MGWMMSIYIGGPVDGEEIAFDQLVSRDGLPLNREKPLWKHRVRCGDHREHLKLFYSGEATHYYYKKTGDDYVLQEVVCPKCGGEVYMNDNRTGAFVCPNNKCEHNKRAFYS